jgi:STE24 endopeptidase
MNIYLLLIVGFMIAEYLLETLVNWKNLQVLQPAVPSEFRELYDAEKYRKAQEYLRATTRQQLLEQGILLLITLLFIAAQGFALVEEWVRSFSLPTIPSGLLYIAVLGLLSSLLQLPFSAYRTFVIEEKFGFNRMNWKTFVGDFGKGVLITMLVGGPILALILWFFLRFGVNAWLYAWVGLVAIQLLLLFVAPAFIMPMFNKFEPLPDGELKQAIESLARKLQFQVKGLFTMDGSKRSAKANAYFTGFGRYRRIVLFDTLIAKHSVNELVAILAHEIGHFRLKHIFKTFTLAVLTFGLLFYLLNWVIHSPDLYAAFGIEDQPIYVGLVFAMLLFTPLGKITSVLGNVLSRKHEFEADAFAAQNFGEPETLITALKKLSVENLSNLSPHKWKVFLDYSHPPVLARIEALRRS